MTEDTELQNDAIDQAIEEASPEIEASQDADGSVEHVEQEETRVPVSAVQKERRKRQDAEAAAQRAQIELQYYKEQISRKAPEPEEEDTSQYESATRAELKQSAAKIKEETLRDLEERIWIKSNAEKSRYVDENLAQFLKQRPNLATAISSASNRYEEAYMLMEALTPKQQAALKPQSAKREAPGSPVGVPKAAGVNQAVDLMAMSDSEYTAWRASKKRR